MAVQAENTSTWAHKAVLRWAGQTIVLCGLLAAGNRSRLQANARVHERRSMLQRVFPRMHRLPAVEVFPTTGGRGSSLAASATQLRTANQDAGEEHKNAPQSDLQCRRERRRLHVAVADPGDDAQFDDDHQHSGSHG